MTRLANNRYFWFSILLGSVGLFAGNMFFWHQAWIGLPVTFIYLGILGLLAGRFIFTNLSRPLQFAVGVLLIITLLALAGSIWAEIGTLRQVTLIIFLGLFSSISLLPAPPSATIEPPNRDDAYFSQFVSQCALSIFLVTQGILLYWLLAGRTGDYIYRYWDLLPASFWVVFAASAITLMIVLLGRLRLSTKLTCLLILTLIVHSSILILGVTEYDGDGYRHLSSERYLATENSLYSWNELDPSRFLYIGSWSLHALLTWMTQLTSDQIHLFFPYLAASIFPIVLLFAIGQLLFRRSILASWLMAASPLFFYELNVHSMISNPKTFGYVLLLFSLFLALASLLGQRKIAALDWLVALASLLVYPISGAFSLLVVTWATLSASRSHWFMSIIQITLGVGFLFLFPFLDSQQGAKLPTHDYLYFLPKVMIAWLTSWLNPNIAASFPILLLFFLVLGWVYLRRQQLPIGTFWLLAFPLLVAQTTFAWRLTLPEQPAFSARIGIPYYVTLLPFLIAGILALVESGNAMLKKNWGVALLVIVLPAFLLAGYIQSPITWNISTHELEAIRTLDAAHPDRNYVVLTEEITSAAANGLLGYTVAPYYRYPSGKLFEYSMAMINDPTTERMAEAAREFDVETVYFLVNHLPPFGPDALAEIKQRLPVYGQFGDVTVFRYPSPLEEETKPLIEIVPAP